MEQITIVETRMFNEIVMVTIATRVIEIIRICEGTAMPISRLKRRKMVSIINSNTCKKHSYLLHNDRTITISNHTNRTIIINKKVVQNRKTYRKKKLDKKEIRTKNSNN